MALSVQIPITMLEFPAGITMLEFPAWKVANQSDLELFEKMLDFRSTVFGIENREYILYRVFHHFLAGVSNRYANVFLSNAFLRFHPTK